MAALSADPLPGPVRSGWDKLREEIFTTQKALGVMATLAGRCLRMRFVTALVMEQGSSLAASRRSVDHAQVHMVLIVLWVGLMAFFAAASTAPAQSDTSGTLKVETKSIAVGVGVSWGDGILELSGAEVRVHGRQEEYAPAP